MDFASWLEGALNARGLSKADLAREMGRKPQTVYSWFNEKRTPTPRLCLGIAEVLGLPAGEVLRRAGHIPEGYTDGALFPVWLQQQMERAGMGDNQSRLATRLNTRPSTVNAWFTRGTRPSPELCRKLATLFGVPLAEVFHAAGHPVDGPREEPIFPDWVRLVPVSTYFTHHGPSLRLTSGDLTAFG